MPFTKNIGSTTSELDMRIALRRGTPEDLRNLKKHSHDMSEMDFANNGGARRLLEELKLEPIDYNKIPNDKLDIEYTPIKYDLTLTPNETNLLFDRAYVVDTNKVHQALNFSLNYTGNAMDYARE